MFGENMFEIDWNELKENLWDDKGALHKGLSSLNDSIAKVESNIAHLEALKSDYQRKKQEVESRLGEL